MVEGGASVTCTQLRRAIGQVRPGQQILVRLATNHRNEILVDAKDALQRILELIEEGYLCISPIDAGYLDNLKRYGRSSSGRSFRLTTGPGFYPEDLIEQAFGINSAQII